MNTHEYWFLQNVDVTNIFCMKKMMTYPEKHLEKKFRKGEHIYLEDDKAEHIYFILSGRVKIGSQSDDDREIIKAVLGKGEVFGELILMGVEKRTDFAIAMEETELCIVHRNDIADLFKERGSIQEYFLNLFGSRMLAMEKRLESLVFKDSRSRIIEFLLQLANNQGQRVGYETVIRKFLTHQEIANLTATSRQTVTTVLNDLRNKEIIKFNRRRLLIRSKDKLALEING